MQALPDDGMQGIQPIGERRRPRLQDDGRLDLVEFSVPHGWDVCPARSRRHAFRTKLLAAPRADDDIRSTAHDLLWIGDDAAMARLLSPRSTNMSEPPAMSMSSDTQ